METVSKNPSIQVLYSAPVCVQESQATPIISNNPSTQAFYEKLRGDGLDHKFAELLALRQPPGHAGTERSFFSAHSDPLAGTHPSQREYLKQRLAANGITNLAGGRYMPSLASEVGDAAAFVHSRTDVKRVLEQRGWGSDGLVKTKVRERDQPLTHEMGPYKVSPKIVEQKMAMEYSEDPALKRLHDFSPQRRADRFHQLSDELSGNTPRRRPASSDLPAAQDIGPGPGLFETIAAKAVD